MDNFSYVVRHFSHTKNWRVVVDQLSALFLFFTNPLLSNKLGCLGEVVFADKSLLPLYCLMACAREGFTIYAFVDNS